MNHGSDTGLRIWTIGSSARFRRGNFLCYDSCYPTELWEITWEEREYGYRLLCQSVHAGVYELQERLVTWIQVMCGPSRQSHIVRLKGLDEGAVYQVEEVGGKEED